ncbi:DnaJ domain-containing protein [Planctomycetota bacterium]
MAKNFYMILGLSRGATGDDIHAAYRRLAKAYHPDRYTGNLKTFLDVQEAYEVLGDPEKRTVYDRQFQAQPPRGKQRYGRYVSETPTSQRIEPKNKTVHLDDISLVRSFETISPSFDEVYDWLWSNFRNIAPPKNRDVQNLTIEVPISVQQARRGGQARIYVPAKALCPACHGHGVVGYYECPCCAGEGGIVGEYPVTVSFPPGLNTDHTVLFSLDRFGIHNAYLSVVFRITASVC